MILPLSDLVAYELAKEVGVTFDILARPGQDTVFVDGQRRLREDQVEITIPSATVPELEKDMGAFYARVRETKAQLVAENQE